MHLNLTAHKQSNGWCFLQDEINEILEFDQKTSVKET